MFLNHLISRTYSIYHPEYFCLLIQYFHIVDQQIYFCYFSNKTYVFGVSVSTRIVWYYKQKCGNNTQLLQPQYIGGKKTGYFF